MNIIRPLGAGAAILLALALLGILLLVSTQPGDGAARRLDLALRQASELAPRIVSMSQSVVTGSALVDPAAALGELGDALERRVAVASDAYQELKPSSLDAFGRIRALAVSLFDSIDPAARNDTDRRADLAALEAELATFRRSNKDVVSAYARWDDALQRVTRDSRALVGDLRSRGASEQADRIVAGTEQLRGLLSGSAEPGAEIGQIIGELAALDVPAGEEARLSDLIFAMRDLAPTRRALIASINAVSASDLPLASAAARDTIADDLLARATTIGQARTLLDVYTALLLAVLVYFAIRLRGSYAELNESYEVLEVRVQERTQDLVKANDDLKESQVQLVQAEKMSSLGQLVAGIMHEINTPLMYVRSNVETTEDSSIRLAEDFAPALALARELRQQTPDRESMNKHLMAVRQSLDPAEIDISIDEISTLSKDTLEGLDQISELVQSLKDFSRLDRADEDWFDLREGLERTLTITKNLLKYGVDVMRDFEEVPKIRCAPSRLNQVFINLVTNAVQAMDGKGRLELSTRSLGDAVLVTVSDSGCGIPEEHLQKIMDPFFTTKPVGQGTGLGLSIVRTIIEEHGGHLDVTSEPGVGTTFSVTLPIERTDTPATTSTEAA